ncbi:MAG: CDP-alcohol phosphatidyltransferase family protein [Oscillospiraceae bacterium]
MNTEHKDKKQIDTHKTWTIPNILSLIRICLVPVIIWLYCFRQAYWLAAIVIGISGLTDILDGIIARKFNMITDPGKLLDPVADKLTQIAIVFCLSIQFVPMRVLMVTLIIKELIILLLTYLAARKKSINSAQWYGKLCTVILFIVIVVHILIPFLSETVSWTLSMIAIGFTVLSLVMYIRFYTNLPNNQ